MAKKTRKPGRGPRIPTVPPSLPTSPEGLTRSVGGRWQQRHQQAAGWLQTPGPQRDRGSGTHRTLRNSGCMRFGVRLILIHEGVGERFDRLTGFHPLNEVGAHLAVVVIEGPLAG